MGAIAPRRGGLEPGVVLQETYRIVRPIGHGGMGEVYEATHARLAGRYAVKLLWSEIATAEVFGRFKREALVTSSLRHPNIVQVIDFNRTEEGLPYLVMEFLEGVELSAELRRVGAMPVPRVVKLVEQVASALTAAHKRGVVHRDLKPQNLFLIYVEGQDHELVKVLDFGISKVREATNPLTRESALIGTPQYMSPEQAQGRQEHVDIAADQFSLAVIAYELLSGVCPFRGDSMPAIVYQVVYENPPLLSAVRPQVNARVAAVVARGMSKKIEDRFPSVLAFSRALAAAAAGLPEPEAIFETGPVQTLIDHTPPPATAATTTFGSSTGETMLRRRSASRRWTAVAALSVLALASIGVSVQRLLRATSVPVAAVAPPPSAPSPPPVVAPAAPETVTVALENAPPNLKITLDGAPVEAPIHLLRGAGTHLLHFEAADYKPYELRVDGSKDRLVRLSMKRRRAASAKMLLDF